jgi:hypothetical protein
LLRAQSWTTLPFGDLYAECRALGIIPRQFEIFAGLDVDKSRIAVTFSDHERLLKSLQIPYSSEHLLNYLGKHFADRKIALAYEVGPAGFGLYDDLTAGAIAAWW